MNVADGIAVHDERIGPVIQLAGGGFFDLLNPESSDFGIEDIAHGLAHLCRFTGHTRTFYSVAQHSVMVSLLVPRPLALAGLLHDAHEAFVGDMATPLKNLLPGYREIELRTEKAVRARFGLPGVLGAEVKRADLVMLATERRDLMADNGVNWAILDGVTPLSKSLTAASPGLAKERFLRRYHEIRGDIACERGGHSLPSKGGIEGPELFGALRGLP